MGPNPSQSYNIGLYQTKFKDIASQNLSIRMISYISRLKESNPYIIRIPILQAIN